jgi:hypothetical protein
MKQWFCCKRRDAERQLETNEHAPDAITVSLGTGVPHDLLLGRVDGFHQDELKDQCDDRGEIPGGLLTA